MYQQAHSERAQDRANCVSLDDIASIGNAQVIHHLQERAEVAIPAVETHKQRSRKDASAKDRTIQEERIGNKCDRGEESLPYSEDNHKNDAEDQQADNKGSAPSLCL